MAPVEPHFRCLLPPVDIFHLLSDNSYFIIIIGIKKEGNDGLLHKPQTSQISHTKFSFFYENNMLDGITLKNLGLPDSELRKEAQL